MIDLIELFKAYKILEKVISIHHYIISFYQGKGDVTTYFLDAYTGTDLHTKDGKTNGSIANGQLTETIKIILVDDNIQWGMTLGKRTSLQQNSLDV